MHVPLLQDLAKAPPMQLSVFHGEMTTCVSLESRFCCHITFLDVFFGKETIFFEKHLLYLDDAVGSLALLDTSDG